LKYDQEHNDQQGAEKMILEVAAIPAFSHLHKSWLLSPI
jgi:hypothetical protein